MAGLSTRARILVVMLVVLVPAAAALAWMVAADMRKTREMAHTQVRKLVDGAAANIEGTLRQAEAALARMAKRPALLAMDPQRCDPVVAELATLSPAYLGLTVLDLQGRGICRYAADPSMLADWDDGPQLVATTCKASLQVSDVFLEPSSGRQAIVLNQPVLNAAGRPVGTLCMAVELLALSRQVLSAMPAQAVINVLDRKGTVALRSAQPEAYIGTPAPGSELQTEFAVSDGYFEGIGRDGVPRLFAAATLQRAGWRVFAGLPREEVLAEYRQLSNRTVVVGVVAALLALGMAAFLSAAIARPIARLQHSASRVAGGDVAARAEISGPPEVQLLARTFNHILDERTLAEARLQGILDTAPDAIITAGEDQQILHANAAAAALLACPIASIVGSPLERFIPHAARAAHAAAVQAFGTGMVITRPMGRRREVSALRTDGTEFPAEATISHLKSGGASLYTVMLRDVTSARQAEKALSDSEAMLRRLLMHLPEAVLVNSSNRISFVNHAAQRLFDGDEAALLERPPLELVAPESQQKARELISSLTPAQPVSGLTELTIASLNGIRRTVETLGTLVEHGAEHSVIVVLRDVTELRQAQAGLETSQADLRRLVAALDRAQDIERRRIARELHDDLQQTMAAIRMDANMLRDRAAVATVDVAAAAARIDELAAQAISSTRRLITGLRPLALDELGLVQALKAMARGFAQRTRVNCAVATSDAAAQTEPPPQVSMCLYRVAQEALNNVAKHAQARSVHIRLAAETNGGWSLCVQDDGRGMNVGDRHKTSSFGLLGMHERVRALGGKLSIEAEAGRGTTVRVVLPAAGPAELESH